MSKYKLTHENYVIRDDGARIPITSPIEFPNENPAYLEYLGFLAAGGAPDPADPLVPIVPEEVSMSQARRALLAVGLYETVQKLIASLPEPALGHALIEWEFAATVNRRHGLVTQLGPALSLTEEQLDSLFILAAIL